MQNIILRSLFITKEAILMEKLNLNLFIVVYQENLLLHRLRKKKFSYFIHFYYYYYHRYNISCYKYATKSLKFSCVIYTRKVNT